MNQGAAWSSAETQKAKESRAENREEEEEKERETVRNLRPPLSLAFESRATLIISNFRWLQIRPTVFHLLTFLPIFPLRPLHNRNATLE